MFTTREQTRIAKARATCATLQVNVYVWLPDAFGGITYTCRIRPIS